MLVIAAAAAQRLASSLPEGLTGALFPFQREGVLFALRHDARVLIADEMGLGKVSRSKFLASGRDLPAYLCLFVLMLYVFTLLQHDELTLAPLSTFIP